MNYFSKIFKTMVLVFVGIIIFGSQSCTNTSSDKLKSPDTVRFNVKENKVTIFITPIEGADSYYVRIYDEHNTGVLKKYLVSHKEAIQGYSFNLTNGNYNVTVQAKDSTGAKADSLECLPLILTIDYTVLGPNAPVDGKYSISYVLNGGKLDNPVLTYAPGETVILPIPTKLNSEFVGWYTDESFLGEPVTVITKTETGNKKYYAKWLANSTVDNPLTGYYEAASNKNGDALKDALRKIISDGAKKTTYDQLKTYLPYTDEDPNNTNNLLLLYSQASVSKKWDPNNSWNREHVWPQSKSWYTTSGAGADVHHLRPEDNKINSSRGNTPYGYAPTGKALIYDGKQIAKYTSSWFEPQDCVKGDIARIVLYLITRYAESDSYAITQVAQSYKVLVEWHLLDPVDDFERTRNERCYSFQNNRNPFIDHPEFVEMIWG